MDNFFDKFNDYFENGFTAAVISIVVMMAVYFVLSRIITKVFKKMGERGRVQVANGLFVVRIINGILLALVVFGIVMQIKPLQQMSISLLAGSGLAVVVVGFAAQETMGNLISGLFISWFRPFVIGDIISLPENVITGTVEDISLRHTVIRTYENTRVIVPNSVINSRIVENISYADKRVCSFLDIFIPLNADCDLARAIISEVVTSNPNYLDPRSEEEKAGGAPPVTIRLSELGGRGMGLKAVIWSSDKFTSFAMLSEIREGIKKEFDKNGIEIAYPATSVYLKGQGQ